MMAAFRHIDMRMPTYAGVNEADCAQVAIRDLRVPWSQWRQDLAPTFLALEQDQDMPTGKIIKWMTAMIALPFEGSSEALVGSGGPETR
jgi:hypothetical protein